MAGTLYLVPTPIGNLGDVSRRTVEILETVDFIAAEDTRITLKLLNHLGIKKPLVSYYRHNTDTAGNQILERLLSGESCALCTDAGTPAISDPGEDLVALCAANDVSVEALPGPCALVVALSVSGLPTARFVFEGFLPLNKKNRRTRLEALAAEERTILLYEAPHKLCATLADLSAALGGDRRITLCRDLTKLHEEILRTTISQAAERYKTQSPRGEFVLVVEGAPAVEKAAATLTDGLMRVAQLQSEGLSRKDAVKQAAKELDLSRNDLYTAALEQ